MLFIWFTLSFYVLLIGAYSLIVGLKVCRRKTIIRNEETLHYFLWFLIFSIPFEIFSLGCENMSFKLKILVGIIISFAIFILFWFLINRKFYDTHGFQILKYIFIFNVSIDVVYNVITNVVNLFNDQIEVHKLHYFPKLHFTIITLRKRDLDVPLYKFEWCIRDNFKNRYFDCFPVMGFLLISVGCCLISISVLYYYYLMNLFSI